jgi:hypothetical protein
VNALNWKKVLLSCILTILILFGGWFLYDYFNMDKPIHAWFDEHQSVELMEINDKGQATEVVVRFHDKNSFYKDYYDLVFFLNQLGDDYQIAIDPEQGMFHPFWKEHSMVIAEAVESGDYDQIKRYIDQLKESKVIHDGYAVVTQDGLFLYIDPARGEDLYLQFPTSLGEGGVAVER